MCFDPGCRFACPRLRLPWAMRFLGFQPVHYRRHLGFLNTLPVRGEDGVKTFIYSYSINQTPNFLSELHFAPSYFFIMPYLLHSPFYPRAF